MRFGLFQLGHYKLILSLPLIFFKTYEGGWKTTQTGQKLVFFSLKSMQKVQGGEVKQRINFNFNLVFQIKAEGRTTSNLPEV